MTVYGVRIINWSSDVCSSDLLVGADDDVEQLDGFEPLGAGIGGGDDVVAPRRGRGEEEADGQVKGAGERDELIGGDLADAAAADGALQGRPAGRGEPGAEEGRAGFAIGRDHV